MNTVNPIPDGYHTLTPYLCIKGAAKALDFYKKAFGAEELFRMEMAPGVIAHAEMQVGNSRFMIADEMPDAKETLSPTTTKTTTVGLMLYVKDVDSVAKSAVAAGMKETRAIKNQFYGDRSGTYMDPFGHCWTIATHVEDVSPEELEKRARQWKG